MITRYNDHAANERTYLAWLRTSLALVAFGFVLERFELFLRTFATTFSQEKLPPLPPVGREAGIILVALGLLTMVLSTLRFKTTSRMIESNKGETYSIRSVVVLGVIFILLSLFILLFITRVLSVT